MNENYSKGSTRRYYFTIVFHESTYIGGTTLECILWLLFETHKSLMIRVQTLVLGSPTLECNIRSRVDIRLQHSTCKII